MTVYARSDVAAVSISPAHGGCGESHSRPVVEGAPVKLWALTCHDGCEDYLRGDPLWSGTPHTVPETPDEVAIRTDVEKRGQAEQQTSIMDALNKLSALGALPTVLAQVLSGHTAAVASEMPITQLCRNGHPNGSASKFCGECGANIEDAVNKQPVAALSASESQDDPVQVVGSSDLENMSLAELRDVARGVGADIARSKREQIDNIQRARG